MIKLMNLEMKEYKELVDAVELVNQDKIYMQ